MSRQAATSPPSLAQLLVSNTPSRGNTDFIPINLSTQPDGTFKTLLPEGQYKISATIPSYGPPATYVVKSLTYGATDLLKDHAGKFPLLYPTSNSDQNGAFELKPIAPGSYRLYSWSSLAMNSVFDSVFIKGFEERGTPVRIEENQRQNLDVKILDEP